MDIGANKGFWAKCLIDNISVNHVYMIDASPENYRELTNEDDNLVFEDQAYFAKLSAYQYAMGSSRGTTTLYTNEDGSPLASLYAPLALAHRETFGAIQPIDLVAAGGLAVAPQQHVKPPVAEAMALMGEIAQTRPQRRVVRAARSVADHRAIRA